MLQSTLGFFTNAVLKMLGSSQTDGLKGSTNWGEQGYSVRRVLLVALVIIGSLGFVYQRWAEWFGTPYKIAIIDSGVDTKNQLIRSHARLFKRIGIFDRGDDNSGHGTSMVSIAAGICEESFENHIPVVSVKAGDQGFDSHDYAQAIIKAASRGEVGVIAAAIGGSFQPSYELFNAFAYAIAKDKIILLPAGNGGHTSPVYPAGYAHLFGSSVVVIGAMDSQGKPTEFTHGSGHNAKQYILFKGENIPAVSMQSERCESISGTSASVALAARTFAKLRRDYPNLKAEQIVTAAFKSGIFVPSDEKRDFGFGQINLPRLEATLKETSYKPSKSNQLAPYFIAKEDGTNLYHCDIELEPKEQKRLSLFLISTESPEDCRCLTGYDC